MTNSNTTFPTDLIQDEDYQEEVNLGMWGTESLEKLVEEGDKSTPNCIEDSCELIEKLADTIVIEGSFEKWMRECLGSMEDLQLKTNLTSLQNELQWIQRISKEMQESLDKLNEELINLKHSLEYNDWSSRKTEESISFYKEELLKRGYNQTGVKV